MLRLTSISATPPASRRLQRPQGPHRERPLRHLRRSEPGCQRVLDLGTILGAAPPYEGERRPKRLPINLRCSPELIIATRGPLLHHQVSTLNRVIGGMVIVAAFILPFFMDWVSAAPSSAQFNYRARSIGVSFTSIYPHGIRSCCSSCGSRAPWTRALTSRIQATPTPGRHWRPSLFICFPGRLASSSISRTYEWAMRAAGGGVDVFRSITCGVCPLVHRTGLGAAC